MKKFLIYLLASFVSYYAWSDDSHKPNPLAFGKLAKFKGFKEIPIFDPVLLNGKTKKEILELRRSFVAKYPEIISGNYTPSEAVFGQIVDGKPWWGVDGLFFFSNGEKSIEGLSERSQMIVNPLLLVDASESSVPFVNLHELDFVSFFNAKFNDPDFHTFPKLKNLLWSPQESHAKVTYEMTRFLQFIDRHASRKLRPEELKLDFRALNARDLGLEFVYVDMKQSSNITRPSPVLEAHQAQDFIHLGGSCNYNGGCNNHSPYQAPLSDYHVTSVPAKVRVLLWGQRPGSVTQRPDFTYDIYFE